MSSTSRAVAVLVAAVVFAFAYVVPNVNGVGPQMDEGAVVSYSARVLEGAVPHRDFLTFYGPGNLWLVAGAFEMFGESITVERAVGMVYMLVIVAALVLLALRTGGLVSGALTGVTASVLLAQDLVWAWATFGALAFGLLGLALATVGVSTAEGRWRTVSMIGGGIACGVGALMRFDFAPAIVVGALPLLTFVPRRARLSFLYGILAAAAVYAAHFTIVGPERTARLVSDIVSSGPGRRLPVDRPWIYPENLVAASILLSLGFVVLGGVLWRRRASDPVPRVMVGIGIFDLLLLPWAFSRLDGYHVRPAALVPLALTPAFALYVVRSTLVRDVTRSIVTAAVIVGTLVALWNPGNFTLDRFHELRGIRAGYRGFQDDDSRAATSAVLDRLRRLARPGESVFVGPQDLRRTNYGPTYMYFELPELRPASYYMEMNPGTANRADSGLADELRRADWLILTTEWDTWNEPNDSMKYGSAEPNRVVRDDFCQRLRSGQYRLYERCDRSP